MSTLALALLVACRGEADPGGEKVLDPGVGTDTGTRPFTRGDDSGTDAAPEILVDPGSWDWGTLWVGCVESLPVTVTNVGGADLVVDGFDLVTASNDLSFDADETVDGPLPWTLAPDETATVYVTYAPLDEGDDEAYLQVRSNDPERPTTQVSQQGSAEVYGTNVDTFEQPFVRATDFLFVVDDSASMAEEQARLAGGAGAFVDALVAGDVDYHLAVVTTDDPTFRGDVITPSTPDVEGELVTQVVVGTDGSGVEMPSEMAYEATQPGGDAGPGGDFLRDDAMFALVVVSDETDASPDNWADYLSYFQGLKTDRDDFVVHAISGDWPSGCGDAYATNTVYEMTVATGGLYLSICATDWSGNLADIAGASVGDQASFELSDWPVPDTIAVRVDGAPIVEGWEYNATDNSVDFDEAHVPAGGSTIEIEYALYGDCEP